MTPRIRLMGGGGLAIEIMDYLQSDGIFIEGYVAPEKDKWLSEHLLWLGSDEEGFDPQAGYVLASGTIEIRKKMISFLESKQANFFHYISSKSYVSSYSNFGKGVFIAPFAIVTGNPVIGDYFFANIHSGVAHHCVVGNNVVLGPGAKVNGNCVLGNNIILGSNASLLPSTRLGDDVEVGINTYPRKTVKKGKLIFSPPGGTLLNE